MPWPPPAGEPLLEALAQAWRASVFTPRRFFPQLGHDQPLLPSLGYYMAVGVMGAGIALFWRMALPAAEPGGLLAELMRARDPGDPLLGFLLSPLWLLVSLFLAAGVVHLFLLVFGGARRGFPTTLRVFCLAYGPQLFVIVPVAGGLIAGLWMTVLAILGLKGAHGTSGGRAAAAVLLPLGVLLLFGMLAAMALLLGRVQL